jgi:hypothetical protein
VYFVTIKRPGYALFSMTPSERAAIGLADDQQRVHLLERREHDWTVVREWPVGEVSHTDFMLRLATLDEPATLDDLARIGSGG